MNPSTAARTHIFSYPHIIWVETVRASGLLLTVLAPRRRIFSRTPRPQIIHTESVIYYSTPDQQSQYTIDLIQAGTEVIPPKSQYRVALSLAEVHEILHDTWGLTLPRGFHPRYPGKRRLRNSAA
jgi:hypothetical protein